MDVPVNAANALAGVMAGNIFNPLNQSDHLNKVSGIEGMNLFQTKPSSEYALFEENSNVFCFKTTDQANNATCRYFAFSEISKEEAMQQISPYLMKGELESFKDNMIVAIKEELASFKEEILNGKQSVRNESRNTNSGNDKSWSKDGK